MPWVRTGDTDTLKWRLTSALRRFERRLGGSAARRVALAVSASLVAMAIVLVIH